MAEVRIIPARDRTSDIKRVAAYARVSSDSEDQLNSFSAQIRYYTDMLSQSTDTTFVNLYADEGISGTGIAKRSDFNRMMSDCRKGKIDRILTKSVSRFARNTKDCLEAVRELKALGVSVYFEKEDIDTAEISSEMMLTLYSQFAQEESISISKNCRMGVQKRMQDGSYINRSVPFGYNYVDGKTVINPETAKIVQMIYKKYLSGKGITEIISELTKENVPPPCGSKKWYFSIIQNIISNERYIGDSLFQKKFTTDTLPFIKKRNRGERQQYYVKDTHEPIIDRETFYAAQELRKSKSTVYCTKKPQRQYPLSRLIKCRCGGTFKRKVVNGKIKWVCRNHDNGADNCEIKAISETEIYSAFIRLYNKLTFAHSEIFPSLIRQLQELADRKITGNSRILEIRRQIAETKDQAHLTAQLVSQGVLDSAYATLKNKELDSKLAALQKRLHALDDTEKEDEQIAEIKHLAAIFENAEPLTKFDEIKFSEIVQKITVVSETELRFTLCGGLEFSENITRKGRR